jgi:hypothetical protein
VKDSQAWVMAEYLNTPNPRKYPTYYKARQAVLGHCEEHGDAAIPIRVPPFEKTAASLRFSQ